MDSEISAEKSYIIEVRCQAIRSAFGFIDHYFLVAGNLEYHKDLFKNGPILPAGTTKGAHTICEKTVCENCYANIIRTYVTPEKKRLTSLSSFVNFEALAMNFSSQTTIVLFTPFIAGLIGLGQYLYAIILTLIGVLILLVWSKYVFSRKIRVSCWHLKDRE
ncbi:Ac81-3 [Venturia canescens]|uniref:Ac81-3 n=1 Tax=Venturia canescens TaxID=32260 RepID=A0ACB9ZIC3_9HYME|nr:uncharacterized LOC122408866 [Venturia canescens]KAI5630637.1 Ac81-3 [Venturia canescens]